MKIRVIKIISFVLIFCILLYSVSRVLRLKNDGGLSQTYMFYEQPKNSIDALFIGSSHVYCDIDPAILYKEYGISSYNFSSSEQTLLLSYLRLKEILKIQKPKLIILEGYMLIFDNLFFSDYSFLMGTLGIKFSLDKINLMKLHIPKTRLNEFFNPFYHYHNRYSSLLMSDFIQPDHIKFYKGLYIQYSVKKVVRNNSFTEERLPLMGIVEEYYRKSILLSKENNIPIIVIISPYSFGDDDNKKFNMAKDIAEEYNVPFINFNLYYDNYNLDFSKDFRDAGHLNYKGVMKFNRYLGKYLKENYDLPDRRGDPKYYSWDMNAKYQYKEIYNFELKQYTNFNEYIEKVKNADDYIIGITMLGNYQKNDAVVQSIATNFNINNIYLQNASYVIDNNKLMYSSSGSNNYLFYKEIGNYTDLAVQNGQKLSINRTNYIEATNGINMVIYDKFTEEIVDNIYLEYQSNAINPTINR
ncbi:hypothetical protein [Brachyspira hampsonii]|uniref:hypothetical protein n=1 Tax=Brachyspira hampsonii TaxID=1287055 RepID=UPI000D3BDF52|nr:hypothetical protein [Brachyspira hampsonii]PTY39720.1 hypothetical protein DQ06_03650 [Brachyspira hampsonii bv. II]